MPTIRYLRDVLADGTKGPHAGLAAIVDYLAHLDARMARIEAMATSPSRGTYPEPAPVDPGAQTP